MRIVIVGAAVALLLLWWWRFGRPRQCRSCGARIDRDEAPFDRIPICWRCW